jgi:hypothetical protein
MSSGTDKAREVLGKATEDQRLYACYYYDLLDLAIKQHESLRAEHMGTFVGDPQHYHAIGSRDYTFWADYCPECLVLLQWEQMWEPTT